MAGDSPRAFGASSANAAMTQPAEEPGPVLPCAAPGPPTDPDLTFIEIVLVDRSGNPQAFEAYEVITPDGETRAGLLDVQGFARVGGVKPGTCRVTFPRYDRRLWRRRA